jgi:transcription antitermination factor NusG
MTVKLSPQTLLQKIAPGETNLKSAQPLNVTEILSGDRVLITLQADDPTIAQRLVLMPASEIAERNKADRLDWEQRGVAGIVTGKTENRITVRHRSLQGVVETTVEVADGARVRRYAPDSVAFADAELSTIEEVRAGDQLRARGTKSEDGLKVHAMEVIFGTFTTRAGTIKEINPETREIVISELGSNKPITVKLKADSQLKKMPSFSGMPGGGSPASGAPSGGPIGPMPDGAMRGSGGPPDVAKMVERMPTASLSDLTPGETVVVSSTKGADESSITAILLLANADMLIRMSTMQAGGPGGSRGSAQAGLGAGMGGASPGMGLGGLDLGGIIP